MIKQKFKYKKLNLKKKDVLKMNKPELVYAPERELRFLRKMKQK